MAVSRRSETGRQEIRAREADGSSASATLSVRLLSLRPLHNMVELATVGGVRVSQIQKSWEAVKRLDRLAPNLAHICRSTWEWI